MSQIFETDRQRSTAGKTSTCSTEQVATTAPPRILLADDQEEMLQTLVEMLKDEFRIVGTAENGIRVLEIAPSLAPDVVVLDISMPGMNGFDAARGLRERCSSARVVFLTAHEDRDMVEGAMSMGALGYVVKSCLATDLVHAIWLALAGITFVSPSIYLA